MADQNGSEDFGEAAADSGEQTLSQFLSEIRKRAVYKMAMDGLENVSRVHLAEMLAEEIQAFDMRMVEEGLSKETGGSQEDEIPQPEAEPLGDCIDYVQSYYNGSDPAGYRPPVLALENGQFRSKEDRLRILKEAYRANLDFGYTKPQILLKIKGLDPNFTCDCKPK